MTGKATSNAQVQSVVEEATDHHSRQLEMCKRLEELADRLPKDFNMQECLSLSWQVYPIVKTAHEFEEQKLFPLLSKSKEHGESLDQSLERLKYEHWEDEAYAEDLCLHLRELVKKPDKANIDKIAYMLRGFFEGIRRHIAFETEHLLPLLMVKNAPYSSSTA